MTDGPLRKVSSAALLGATMGALLSLRWLTTLRGAETLHAARAWGIFDRPVILSFFAAIATVGALTFALTAYRPRREKVLAIVCGAVLASAAWAVGASALEAAAGARLGWSIVFLAAGAALIIAGRQWDRAHLGYSGAFLLMCAVLGHCRLGATWGDDLARSAAEYVRLPLASYYAKLGGSWALFGAAAGACAAVMLGEAWSRWAQRGFALGCALAGIEAVAHTAAAMSAMQKGLDPAIPVLVHTSIWVMIAIGVGARFGFLGAGRVLSWVWVVLGICAACGYCVLAGRGTSAYFALKNLHADAAYIYVHFASENTWRRTFDNSGSLLRLERCRQFLRDYPFCAYRPAAEALLASTAFDLWQFDHALRTSRLLREHYGRSIGSSSVVQTLAAYASGSVEELFARFRDDCLLERWSRTYGGLITAAAAERAGSVSRALGAYNSYAEFLSGLYPTGWRDKSVRYARANADKMRALMTLGIDCVPRGTVIGRVSLQGKPVSGVRVVLVRPHPDAALPKDSKQFTGARTIAAWAGVYAVSGSDGKFVMTRVPYGRYEAVVGLDARLARQGIVIAPPVKPVTVCGRVTAMPAIRLVPAVKQLWPRQGSVVSRQPTLTWRPYPGAAYYSVSVLAVDRCKPKPVPMTCWARSRIRTPFTRVTADYFLNGTSSLEKGGVYTWIVYAYSSDGKLISSSEHYDRLHEPEFRVK
ncbi:MAG: hypothetical protein QHI38_11680 [Armatimonadota bacterium]|nr:hypothetical protein [Armatimonadota bacterium]